MNSKAQQVHAANQERILRERTTMRRRFGAKKLRAETPSSERFSRGLAEVEKKQLCERICLRCEMPFMSEGIHHRMCRSCSRLPEGFGF